MTHTPAQLTTWLDRPFSWSQYSSWQYDKYAWYDRYILGNSTPSTPALEFGKKFADSVEWGTPMAPVTLLPKVEHPMTAELDTLKLTGFLDTWDPEKLICGEFKTGVKKWDQKRVDEHGQLTFYALLHYLKDKVKPEDVQFFLEWLPTCVHPNLKYGFTDPAVIHHFDTSRTTRQVLELAVDIQKVCKEMHTYALSRLSTGS